MIPRKLFLLVVFVGLLAVGLYWGLSRDSQDRGENRPTGSLKVQRETDSRTPGASGAYPARPQENTLSSEGTLRSWEAQKRSGPIPVDDTEDVLQLISEALDAPEPDDRAFAVSELGLLEPTSEIVLACFEALEDTEEDVRAEAVLALEMLEETSAIPLLRRVAQEDPSEEVREAAYEAIENLMNP